VASSSSRIVGFSGAESSCAPISPFPCQRWKPAYPQSRESLLHSLNRAITGRTNATKLIGGATRSESTAVRRTAGWTGTKVEQRNGKARRPSPSKGGSTTKRPEPFKTPGASFWCGGGRLAGPSPSAAAGIEPATPSKNARNISRLETSADAQTHTRLTIGVLLMRYRSLLFTYGLSISVERIELRRNG
jgi:hypothetical protein